LREELGRKLSGKKKEPRIVAQSSVPLAGVQRGGVRRKNIKKKKNAFDGGRLGEKSARGGFPTCLTDERGKRRSAEADGLKNKKLKWKLEREGVRCHLKKDSRG